MVGSCFLTVLGSSECSLQFALYSCGAEHSDVASVKVRGCFYRDARQRTMHPENIGAFNLQSQRCGTLIFFGMRQQPAALFIGVLGLQEGAAFAVGSSTPEA